MCSMLKASMHVHASCHEAAVARGVRAAYAYAMRPDDEIADVCKDEQRRETEVKHTSSAIRTVQASLGPRQEIKCTHPTPE